MAYMATTKRNHARAPAIVLGTLVLVAFTVFMLAAAPGKTILQANGMSSGIDPITEIGKMYSAGNIDCAFGQMSCSIFP